MLTFPESGNRIERYLRPTTLEEVFEVVAAEGPRGRLTAGACAVLPSLRAWPQGVETLIDLGGVASCTPEKCAWKPRCARPSSGATASAAAWNSADQRPTSSRNKWQNPAQARLESIDIL